MYKLWSKWDTDHHSTTPRQTCHGCIMGGTGGERCRSVYINLVSVESQLDTASRDHNVTISLSMLDSTFYTNNLSENRFECHIPHITAVLNRSSCHTKGVYIFCDWIYNFELDCGRNLRIYAKKWTYLQVFQMVTSIWMKIKPNSICFAGEFVRYPRIISVTHCCFCLFFFII